MSNHFSPWTAQGLRAARSHCQWSQAELARQANVHVQTVKYWERQTNLISGWAVNRFKAAFNQVGFDIAEIEHAVLPNLSLEQSVKALCGAKTRRGTPCLAKAMPDKARCRMHGGLSTGPKTIEGRERVAQAQRFRWRSQIVSNENRATLV